MILYFDLEKKLDKWIHAFDVIIEMNKRIDKRAPSNEETNKKLNYPFSNFKGRSNSRVSLSNSPDENPFF